MQEDGSIKPLFIDAPSPTARFVACVIFSFFLISIDSQRQNLFAVRGWLSALIYPLQYAVGLPVKMVDSVVDSLSSQRALLHDNQQLREENLLLRTRAQKFAALESENKRLRALLDSTPELGEDVVVADVLAIESNASKRQIVINKGSRNHVYVGQPIADDHGILGQVAEVGPFSSTAILISDARHALPVQINRNGVRAVAMGGDSGDGLSLSFVPNNADIQVGDLVVSSGLDHRFPAGIPVGEVDSVTNDPGAPFARIKVKPSAHIGREREVLLVWPRSAKRETAAPLSDQ